MRTPFTPSEAPTGEIISPYVPQSHVLNDIKRTRAAPFEIRTISLASAGELFISTFGHGLVIYGHDGSATKAVNSTALVNLWIENQDGNPFPLKHSRGFVGPFTQIWLRWPAQSGVFVDLVIYKNTVNHPYVNGEAAT